MLFLNFSSIHIKTNYCITILSAKALLSPAKVTGQCVMSKETPQPPRPGGRSAGVTQAAAELRCSPKLDSKTRTKSLLSSARETSTLRISSHIHFTNPSMQQLWTHLARSFPARNAKEDIPVHTNHDARKTPNTPTAKRCIQEALGQKELRFLGNARNKE